MTTPAEPTNLHSAYGASAASRWRRCPGSVRLIADALETGEITKEQSTGFAEEGTKAHEYATQVLTGQITIADVPDDFAQHLAGYIHHCQSVEAAGENSGKNSIVINEETIPLFFRAQDVGTIDHAVVTQEFIHITDLKYGAGVKVYAEDNDQAQIYAASLLFELEIMHSWDFDDITPVLITIYQPRHHSFDGYPDTWETSVHALRAFADMVERDYKTARQPGAPLNPSERACQFCKAKHVCKARAQASFGGLPEVLSIDRDFDLEDTEELKGLGTAAGMRGMSETLTAKQVAFICSNASTIKKVVDSVVKGETERIKAGGQPRGVKLVSGKLGNRTWTDQEEAEKLLVEILGHDSAYRPRQLLTAPQALKMIIPQSENLSPVVRAQLGLGDEDTTDGVVLPLVHRPPGNPKLVAIDAPGDALTFTKTEEEFDIIQNADTVPTDQDQDQG